MKNYYKEMNEMQHYKFEELLTEIGADNYDFLVQGFEHHPEPEVIWEYRYVFKDFELQFCSEERFISKGETLRRMGVLSFVKTLDKEGLYDVEEAYEVKGNSKILRVKVSETVCLDLNLEDGTYSPSILLVM